jgi:hypothetical protein
LSRTLENQFLLFAGDLAKGLDILHDLAGAVWRLEEYRYMQFTDELSDEESDQMDHWIAIMRTAVDEARTLLGNAPDTKA